MIPGKNASNREWGEVSTAGPGLSYPEEGNELCYQLEEHSFWFRHRNNCIVEVVKKFPPRGFLFDVGGGNGFVTKALEDSGIRCVLVEPGQKGVENAGKRGVTHIIRSTLEDAGFRPHTLPGVGLFDVLEHIRDFRAFLKTVFHLLEPGGRLYITVPAFQFLWSGDDNYARHLKRFTLKCMRKRLQEIDFHIDYATYIFSPLPLPIFLSRSLPYRLGFTKKPDWESRYKNGHSQRNGIAGKLLEKVWNAELKRIRNKKTIPLGSSCLIAAGKG
jgi:SAM-dependent methyltransferase